MVNMHWTHCESVFTIAGGDGTGLGAYQMHRTRFIEIE